MPKTTPKISVIVTVLNEEHTIERLLNALAQQRRKPDEIVIVDGGSTDHTFQVLKHHSRRSTLLKVFQQPGNRSVGRNYALTQATHDWIAITDAGCIPHPEWLAQLEKKAIDTGNNLRSAVIAGYYEAQPQTPFEEAVVPYFLVMPDRVNPHTFLPATRSMMLPKSAWKKVGGFREDLRVSEDYEFAHRLKGAGYHSIFAQKARVSWLPLKSLPRFAQTVFQMARDDVRGGVFRPKGALVVGRYGVALVLATLLLQWLSVETVGLVLLLGFGLYLGWAIKKNLRYAPHGWYWLPVLQITADLAVMWGSLSGSIQRLQHRATSV